MAFPQNKIQVSEQCDFVIEKDTRAYNGPAAVTVLKVDGTTGVVQLNGVPLGGVALTQVATVTIPTAAVKTLNATPVQLIPAPPANTYIEVISVHAMLKFGTIAYDGVAAGDVLELRYTNAAGALLNATVSPVGFGNAAADAHVTLTPATSGWIPANAPVVAHIAATEWFTAAGDSALKFEVLYRVRPLAL